MRKSAFSRSTALITSAACVCTTRGAVPSSTMATLRCQPRSCSKGCHCEGEGGGEGDGWGGEGDESAGDSGCPVGDGGVEAAGLEAGDGGLDSADSSSLACANIFRMRESCAEMDATSPLAALPSVTWKPQSRDTSASSVDSPRVWKAAPSPFSTVWGDDRVIAVATPPASAACRWRVCMATPSAASTSTLSKSDWAMSPSPVASSSPMSTWPSGAAASISAGTTMPPSRPYTAELSLYGHCDRGPTHCTLPSRTTMVTLRRTVALVHSTMSQRSTPSRAYSGRSTSAVQASWPSAWSATLLPCPSRLKFPAP
mmetsp:Transcript_34947/g.87949  ORF Transcript_34947/g.87949 Transcript_34947/m.87949 type:complete len:313 (-) Transcript_34947:156-1094(-)